MSEEIHEGKIIVTRFTGPAGEGADRARWQFTLPYAAMADGYVVLDRGEAVVLAAVLFNSAADIPDTGGSAASENP